MAFPYLFLPDQDEVPRDARIARRARGSVWAEPAEPVVDLPADPAERDRVLRICEGDEAAYAALFTELHVALREFATTYGSRAAEAEEIVQDVFLDLWVRRAQWAPRHGVRAYLFRAVRNRAADALRHAHVADRLDPVAVGEAPAGMGEGPAEPGAAADVGEFTVALRAVIGALPEARRRAALLRWRHGLSYAEIAEAMGVTVASVTMHVARAREAIRPVVERFTDG